MFGKYRVLNCFFSLIVVENFFVDGINFVYVLKYKFFLLKVIYFY